jgi:hypothetical protein
VAPQDLAVLVALERVLRFMVLVEQEQQVARVVLSMLADLLDTPPALFKTDHILKLLLH